MGWIDHVITPVEATKRNLARLLAAPAAQAADSAFEDELRERLRTQDARYRGEVLEGTVADVLALDEDLFACVRRFVMEGAWDGTQVECPFGTLDDLTATGAFTPVAAALFAQWAREDPKEAARYLLGRDSVSGADVDAEGDAEPLDEADGSAATGGA